MKYLKFFIIFILVTFISLEFFTSININKWLKAAGYFIIAVLLFVEYSNKKK